jgi:hypothetical protein
MAFIGTLYISGNSYIQRITDDTIKVTTLGSVNFDPSSKPVSPASQQASSGTNSGTNASNKTSGTGSSTSSTVPSPAVVNKTVVSSDGFVHPGILVNQAQLNFVKNKVATGAVPWSTAFSAAKNSASATLLPHLTGMVELSNGAEACNPANPGSGCVTNCGTDNVPDYGCSDETTDASAAYTQALLWYYTGQESYAQSAIAILNGWSAVLKNHTGSNKALQAAWAAENFTRAAEIIRYTYNPSTGKTALNLPQFTAMLQTAFLPLLNNFTYGSYNGNWDLTVTDARMDIAVFTDNRPLYNAAVAQWQISVPRYIYLASDGALPLAVSGHQSPAALTCFWLDNKASSCSTSPATVPVNPDNAPIFENGQSQESCRDFGHETLGLDAMLDTAETGWIQGTDLYGEQQTRIMTAVEYITEISLSVTKKYDTSGHPTFTYPKDFCDNLQTNNPSTGDSAFELAYNAYTVRRGVQFQWIPIPNVPNLNENPLQTYINNYLGTLNNTSTTGTLMDVWETLTDHDVGAG